MMMNNLYSNRIKELQLQILRNQFELISKNTILQLTILKQLFDEPKTQALYEEALSNEIIIDRLEVKIREEVAFSIFKFSPVAEDLRRIIVSSIEQTEFSGYQLVLLTGAGSGIIQSVELINNKTIRVSVIRGSHVRIDHRANGCFCYSITYIRY